MNQEKDSRHMLGQWAEDWVAARLQDQGWTLLGRNLRTPYAEIDLLGLPPAQDTLVVVEVKARQVLSLEQDEETLRPRQRRRLARALEYLALRMDWQHKVRADLYVLRLQGEEVVHGQHLPAVDLYAR